MHRGRLFVNVGWYLVAGLVGSVLVVVPLVGGEDVAGVGIVHDEDVVEGFAADAADDAFAVRVHAGGPGERDRRAHFRAPRRKGLGECLGVVMALIDGAMSVGASSMMAI